MSGTSKGPFPPNIVVMVDNCLHPDCGAKVEIRTSKAGYPSYTCDGAIEGKACGDFHKFGPRHVRRIFEAYQAGQSIDDLAREYGVKLSTIINHLYLYLREGNLLRADGILNHTTVSDAQQQQILEAFQTLGTDFLSPVFKAANRAVNYDDLHILRLYYLVSIQK